MKLMQALKQRAVGLTVHSGRSSTSVRLRQAKGAHTLLILSFGYESSYPGLITHWFSSWLAGSMPPCTAVRDPRFFQADATSRVGLLQPLGTQGGDYMNIRALLFSIAGAIVALFYALESFLFYQASGFAVPLLAKILICVVGAYVFWRNVRRIKKVRSTESTEAA